jgi:DNA-binding transcriptional regulator YdaS (Cro superfamily)
MRLIDLQSMRKLLGREVARAGGQVAWAKRHGLHPSTINKVLNDQRLPGPRMLAALNLRKVIAYHRPNRGG